MIPPPDHLRDSIRMDARLDSMARTKVDELATRFHQPRAAVLCHIMEWSLSREETRTPDQGESQGPVRHLSLCVASELQARVQKAATAAGVKTPSWLRHMVRQISIADFPPSWQEEQSAERSHDSLAYDTRFMLRLNGPLREKLQDLVEYFDVSKAAIIRQLIAQTAREDFPQS
jgi:predicted transcriptional regulator